VVDDKPAQVRLSLKRARLLFEFLQGSAPEQEREKQEDDRKEKRAMNATKKQKEQQQHKKKIIIKQEKRHTTAESKSRKERKAQSKGKRRQTVLFVEWVGGVLSMSVRLDLANFQCKLFLSLDSDRIVP
jgi:hypothetical protein